MNQTKRLERMLSKVRLLDVSAPLIGDTGTMADFQTTAPFTWIDDDGVLHVSAENGDDAADYYGEFRGGLPHINPKLEAAAKTCGMYWEWDHAGSISAYEN